MKVFKSILFFSVLSAAILIGFQNCDGGFEPNGQLNLGSTGESGNDGGGNDNGNGNIVTQVSFSDFEICHGNAGAAGIANCLENRDLRPSTLTQIQINNCVSTYGDHPRLIATCLGQLVSGARFAGQADIQACAAAVGNDSIATCLSNRGLLVGGAQQSNISTCITNAGIDGVEACLRANNFIPRRVLDVAGLKTCQIVVGDTGIRDCLVDNGSLRAVVQATDVATCISNAGVDGAVNCLRNGQNLSSKTLLQAHISQCSDWAGQDNIAACLTANGILPEKVSVADPTVFEPITQADIQTCINNVGLGSVSRCFRVSGYLPREVSRFNIQACGWFAGRDSVSACLSANGLQPAVAQADVDTCLANNGNNLRTVQGCLVTQGALTSFADQSQLYDCAKNSGSENIVACLGENNILPDGVDDQPLPQAQVDTCVANVGVPGLETCLKNNNFLPPTFTELSDAGNANLGIFANRCAECHNAVDLRGGLNLADHAMASGLVDVANPLASTLYQRLTVDDPANNMPIMPRGAARPALTPEELRKVTLWMLDGAPNN